MKVRKKRSRCQKVSSFHMSFYSFKIMILLKSATVLIQTWYNFSPLNDLFSVWVTTQYRINHLGNYYFFGAARYHMLNWPLDKLNWWQIAETDKMEVESLSLVFFHSLSAVIRLCLTLNPLFLTVFSWISSLKVKGFQLGLNETRSFTESDWYLQWIGFAHYRSRVLFLTDELSGIWAWRNEKQISDR